MKIAFLQIVARHSNPKNWVAYESGWSYLISTGLFKALKHRYSDIDYISSDSQNLSEQLDKIDIVLVNDIHHAFGNFGDVCGFDLDILIKICRTKKAVGILNETVYFSDSQSDISSASLQRAKIVNQSIPLFHGIITADYSDYLFLNRSSVNVLYSPFASPIFKDAIPRNALTCRPIFLGSLYQKRKTFLELNGLLDRLVVSNIAYDVEGGSICCEKIGGALNKNDTVEYFNCLDNYKSNQIRKFLLALKASKIVVNLPSIFRGIPCRLVESAQLSSYILCEFPRTEFELSLCSGLSNIIFYHSNVVGDLMSKLDIVSGLPQPNPSDISNTLLDISVRSEMIIDFLLNDNVRQI